jgi:hypothetical protein
LEKANKYAPDFFSQFENLLAYQVIFLETIKDALILCKSKKINVSDTYTIANPAMAYTTSR